MLARQRACATNGPRVAASGRPRLASGGARGLAAAARGLCAAPGRRKPLARDPCARVTAAARAVAAGGAAAGAAGRLAASGAPPPPPPPRQQQAPPEGLGGAGLPPQPQAASKRGSSGGGGGGGGGRPPRPRPRSKEETALGLLTFAGVVGTAATLLGGLAHVDPFGHAHWDARDVALGLGLASPVLLLDLAIMLPDHRRGEAGVLDRLERAAADKLARLEAQLREAEELATLVGQGEGGVSGSGDASSSGGSDGSISSGGAGSGNSISSGGAGSARAGAAAAAAAASSSDGAAGSSGAPPAAAPSPAWLEKARNGLFLAQGRLAPANPAAAARLPLALEAAVVGAECLASEMLWRAVLLQAAGGWVSDRMFEADAEDMLHVGPYLLSTRAAGTCLAAAAVVTLSAVSAAQRVARAGRGGLADELRSLALTLKQRRANRDKGGAGAGPKPPPAAPGSSGTSGSAPTGGSSGGGGGSAKRDEQRPPAPPLGGFLPLPGGGLIPTTLSALTLGEAVVSLRGLALSSALCLGFAATGNLAASLAGSLASAAVFSLASRYRLRLLREVRRAPRRAAPRGAPSAARRARVPSAPSAGRGGAPARAARRRERPPPALPFPQERAAADEQLATLRGMADRFLAESRRIEALTREAEARGRRGRGAGGGGAGGGGEGGGALPVAAAAAEAPGGEGGGGEGGGGGGGAALDLLDALLGQVPSEGKR